MNATNRNKAWVANYPALQDLLRSRDGVCMWQRAITDDPDARGSGYVECWLLAVSRGGMMVARTMVLLIVRSHGMGWELYTACDPGDL